MRSHSSSIAWTICPAETESIDDANCRRSAPFSPAGAEAGREAAKRSTCSCDSGGSFSTRLAISCRTSICRFPLPSGYTLAGPIRVNQHLHRDLTEMIHCLFICRLLYWTFPMLRILPILGLTLALPCGAFAQTPTAPLTLTLQDAMERARANSQQLLSADIAARLAREDKVQAKAALLPSVNWENGFSYTQSNGPDNSLTFVTNDGPRVYTNLANVHADVYAPGKRADYQMAIASEAIARAKVDIAARGLTAVVVQNFYGTAVAQRHYNNARRSLQEAQQFVDITQKLEAGGEAAHSDVIKAQLTLVQRPKGIDVLGPVLGKDADAISGEQRAEICPDARALQRSS